MLCLDFKFQVSEKNMFFNFPFNFYWVGPILKICPVMKAFFDIRSDI